MSSTGGGRCRSGGETAGFDAREQHSWTRAPAFTRAGAVVRGRTDDGYPLLLAELGGGGFVVRIRVLVVDDHRIFAESLAAALAAEPDVDV
ncbi:DNA-binding response regulator, partial [Streptomyces sp. SID5926]|nr:DNA-binding response regulator [Streptomyces sp. SID5926]